MSLYDKASLVMIPSGYKASSATLYSVLPNTSVGDFDVTVDADATRVNKDGFIESVAANQARLDYPLTNGVVGDCPHLLLEPSRQNKLLQSNQFDTTWILGSTLSLTGGQTSALTGNNDAWLFSSDGTSGFGQINQSVSFSGSHVFSVFAKKGTNDIISLRSLSGLDVRAEFNLNTGSLNSESNTTSTEIKSYGNGWYRVSMTFSATNTNVYIYPNRIGTADAGNIYIQNAQLEAGSYPTSYIPTTTASVTRSADTCNSAGDSSTFNDSEGVLFAEIANIDENNTTDTVSISISDGTLNNAVTLYYFATGDIYYDIFNSSGTRSGNASMTKSEQSNFNRIALKYKSTDISLWVNGFELSTNSGTLALSGLSELAFDYGNGIFDYYGKVKQLMVFNEALSDSELQQLTS